MQERTEHWFNYDMDGAHIVFTVESTGTVEVSYELWAEILDMLGFKPELNTLDAKTDA